MESASDLVDKSKEIMNLLRALSLSGNQASRELELGKLLQLLRRPAAIQDQDLHLLTDAVGESLRMLDAEQLVEIWVPRILAVVGPLLSDANTVIIRGKAQEIIANLSKAAGLDAIVAAIRPHVGGVTVPAAVIATAASALGVPALMPLLKELCGSEHSWQTRHAGMRAVEQIPAVDAIPHIETLVGVVSPGLTDENIRVQRAAAFSVAALAEAAAPHGFDIFDPLIRPLWRGLVRYRGESLAAFSLSLCAIIRLMDAIYASYYAGEVLSYLPYLLGSPDEEMKVAALRILEQCVSIEGPEADCSITESIAPLFFKRLWASNVGLDRSNYKLLMEATMVMAKRVGLQAINRMIAEQLHDEGEPYMLMVMESVEKALITTSIVGSRSRSVTA